MLKNSVHLLFVPTTPSSFLSNVEHFYERLIDTKRKLQDFFSANFTLQYLSSWVFWNSCFSQNKSQDTFEIESNENTDSAANLILNIAPDELKIPTLT